jgi:hypothetical protein
MGDGPLHAADDAAVHHDRAVPGPVRPEAVQAELLRLVEVDLHGGRGGLPPGAVGDLDVDHRAVEGGLPSAASYGRPEASRSSVSSAVDRCHFPGAATYLPPGPPGARAGGGTR